jgi:hypothetical protein
MKRLVGVTPHNILTIKIDAGNMLFLVGRNRLIVQAMKTTQINNGTEVHYEIFGYCV